ncbi:hypothetical protein GCM10022216_00660 [Sphingobacterium kyonggiense]|uniref:Uncharacterized protein n=1 Tax=Sphingobacterium kyonggiense TaxID=714075 RepID=A0ABP7Y5Z7_9SPHI
MFCLFFAVLYFKDPNLAESILPKCFDISKNIKGLVKTIYLLVVADIQRQLVKQIGGAELNQLLNNSEEIEDWKAVGIISTMGLGSVALG